MLYVFDKNLKHIGILPSVKTLIWQESYNETGKLFISAADKPKNIRLLRHGNILYQKGKDVAMRISYVKYELDERTKERLITATGFTTMELLAQRVIYDSLTIINAEAGVYRCIAKHTRIAEHRA